MVSFTSWSLYSVLINQLVNPVPSLLGVHSYNYILENIPPLVSKHHFHKMLSEWNIAGQLIGDVPQQPLVDWWTLLKFVAKGKVLQVYDTMTIL